MGLSLGPNGGSGGTVARVTETRTMTAANLGTHRSVAGRRVATQLPASAATVSTTAERHRDSTKKSRIRPIAAPDAKQVAV